MCTGHGVCLRGGHGRGGHLRHTDTPLQAGEAWCWVLQAAEGAVCPGQLPTLLRVDTHEVMHGCVCVGTVIYMRGQSNLP